MKRIKNPHKCRYCKDELPYGHLSSVCNFCTNQQKAKVATKFARYEAERFRREAGKVVKT